MPKIHGPYSQLAWQDKTFKTGSDGAMDVPQEAVAELLAIGMKLGTPAQVAELHEKIEADRAAREETVTHKGKKKG